MEGSSWRSHILAPGIIQVIAGGRKQLAVPQTLIVEGHNKLKEKKGVEQLVQLMSYHWLLARPKTFEGLPLSLATRYWLVAFIWMQWDVPRNYVHVPFKEKKHFRGGGGGGGEESRC